MGVIAKIQASRKLVYLEWLDYNICYHSKICKGES
jgi:hypothetical protein